MLNARLAENKPSIAIQLHFNSLFNTVCYVKYELRQFGMRAARCSVLADQWSVTMHSNHKKKLMKTIKEEITKYRVIMLRTIPCGEGIR